MAEEFTDDIGVVNQRLLEPVPFVRTNNCIKDVDAELFIKAYASYLKLHNKITFPKWCNFVKTGKGRKLAPLNEDWYFVKASSILRKLYLSPDIGVGYLRRHYSYKQRRGVAPNHTSLASGKILRSILQQLENLGYVEQNPKKKGRRLTTKGENAINNFARYINKKVYKLDKE
ncbi:40S ribosomal protein S19, putative [Plasmodium knowlesi strain H]|uniref:40S ribosomal protein S19, putative n=3 Tax=Plasmodium knowlesi TaxID=5850 RepID=A0A5K1UC62_PLAKH|nr:40S ribosomal protein S19, putative [Plasmodium knowlesi strain H]OTN67946.1 putative 40S ribosomal protein S19 [Plasmodium knowlesi]CAA9987029.1 40S ribosomal protein S19, putative [Plasmodium knowlesi strain H]SBO26703.1 40S ribosomal protein S19, putative [Plasmodium knowlesi strain H]SBO28234.1 40S ribosomal protein S19, putative [Plasmodium knowlesi strain H]VVS76503.1 40S ribosomal protein S19, putative [Plasmodium knowlesi strain H]|eukprot:XP_002258274.1 ribosomal protein S19s, putative [Plasmodium knowlesi strain H]